MNDFDPAPIAEVLWRLIGEGGQVPRPSGAPSSEADAAMPAERAPTPERAAGSPHGNRPADAALLRAGHDPFSAPTPAHGPVEAPAPLPSAHLASPGATPQVRADVEGWFSLVEVCRALSDVLARQIGVAHLQAHLSALTELAMSSGTSPRTIGLEARVEIRDMRIRLLPVEAARASDAGQAVRAELRAEILATGGVATGGTASGGPSAVPAVHPGLVSPLRRPPPRAPAVPDLLFHATTESAVRAALRTGLLAAPGARGPGWAGDLGGPPDGRRRLLLSASEDQAWRAAHRLAAQRAGALPPGEVDPAAIPRVLVVDVPRARRAGVRFHPHRPEAHRASPLFATWEIPVRHLLDLHDGFDTQVSAGGIPVRRFPDGRLRMALVRVGRRSGTTWEVAKGKLEPGETPEAAAVREVQEEMGLTASLSVLRFVAPVRYGFLAPGGLPRLKTVFLYLLHSVEDDAYGAFRPARAEGIHDVGWFLPEEAAAAVSHPSLIPAMATAAALVHRYGLQPERPGHDVVPPEDGADDGDPTADGPPDAP